MSHIFISYSRKDLIIAEKIVNALAKNSLETWIDWKNIPPGEQFTNEIIHGIEASEVFLFLISPDSVKSNWCKDEINIAINNGKRIIPILINNTEIKEIEKFSAPLSNINWIACQDGVDDFGTAIKKIQDGIRADYKWVKYHTKLQVKSLDWEQRKDDSRLLRGKDIQEAEQQLASIGSRKDPQPTDLQRRFVLESRKAEQNRRKTTTRVAIGVSLTLCLFCVLALTGGSVAYLQSNAKSTAQIQAATAQTVSDQKTSISRSQALVGFIDKNKNSDQINLLLSIEALKSVNGLPRVDNLLAEQALRDNLSQVNGIPLVGKGNVNDVAFSPDGQWLAIGGYDNNVVRLWKVKDVLSEPIILEGPIDSIRIITFSPNGRWLASDSFDNTIFVWDMQDLGKKPTILSGHTEHVNMISFSPDGKWLISASSDSTILMWNIDNFSNAPIVLSGHTNGVYRLAFSPDGNWLVSSGGDGKVYLWNINDKTPLPKTLYHDENGAYFGLKFIFSPNAEWLAINPGLDILLVNMKTMSISELDFDVQELLAFTPDSTRLVATTNHNNMYGQIVLRNIQNSQEEFIPELGGVSQLIFSPDGKWLVAVVPDGNYRDKIRIVEVQNPKKPIELTSFENSITAIDFSPDSQWIAAGGSNGISRLWNINNLFAEPKILPAELSGHVSNIAISSNGRFLAASGTGFMADSRNMVVYIWDLVNPTLSTTILEVGFYGPDGLIFSSDNKILAVIDDSRVALWNLASLTEPFAELNNPRDPQETNREFINVVLSPDNKHIITSDLNAIHLWDVENLSSDPAILMSSPFVGTGIIKYSPSGHWLVLFYEDTVYLWNMNNFVPEPTKFTQSYLLNGKAVAFSPDDELLATGSDNGDIRIWKTEAFTEKPVMVYGHEAPVQSLIFSTDKKWLISTDDNHVVRVWDIENNFKEIVTFNEINPSMIVENVIVSPDGHWVAAISSNTVIYIWDLTDLTRDPIMLNGHEDKINVLQFSPDSKWLFSGGEDRSVRVWSMDRDYLLTLACQIVGRNLSKNEWDLYLQNEPYNKTCEQWSEGVSSQLSP